MADVSVRDFFRHVKEPLGLRLCTGEQGLDRVLKSGRIQKPGLALAGYNVFVHEDRVQVLGETEISYLSTLPDEDRTRAVASLLERDVACIVVTKGLTLPLSLTEGCERSATPLFVTEMTSSKCMRKLMTYLDDLLSPRCSIHGVLVEVDGIGVLITGDSGIGKSECALDLIRRGHRLVADDVVEIRRRGEDLVGQAQSLIQNLIEIRGLGILDVAELYGVAATRDHKRIELSIHLEAWSPEVVYDRIGLDTQTKDILGLEVRSFRVPVQPGRNIAGIVEVAARNVLLQLRGHHAARNLDRRIREAGGDESQPPELGIAARFGEVTDHIEDEVE